MNKPNNGFTIMLLLMLSSLLLYAVYEKKHPYNDKSYYQTRIYDDKVVISDDVNNRQVAVFDTTTQIYKVLLKDNE